MRLLLHLALPTALTPADVLRLWRLWRLRDVRLMQLWAAAGGFWRLRCCLHHQLATEAAA